MKQRDFMREAAQLVIKRYLDFEGVRVRLQPLDSEDIPLWFDPIMREFTIYLSTTYRRLELVAPIALYLGQIHDHIARIRDEGRL